MCGDGADDGRTTAYADPHGTGVWRSLLSGRVSDGRIGRRPDRAGAQRRSRLL